MGKEPHRSDVHNASAGSQQQANKNVVSKDAAVACGVFTGIRSGVTGEDPHCAAESLLCGRETACELDPEQPHHSPLFIAPERLPLLKQH